MTLPVHATLPVVHASRHRTELEAALRRDGFLPSASKAVVADLARRRGLVDEAAAREYLNELRLTEPVVDLGLRVWRQGDGGATAS